jgi:hypothetical protein
MKVLIPDYQVPADKAVAVQVLVLEQEILQLLTQVVVVVVATALAEMAETVVPE